MCVNISKTKEIFLISQNSKFSYTAKYQNIMYLENYIIQRKNDYYIINGEDLLMNKNNTVKSTEQITTKATQCGS